MKHAADFKTDARNALCGNWGVAILTGFVASLIGASTISGPVFNVSQENTGSVNVNSFGQWIYPILITLIALIAVSIIISIIMGGAGKLGYAKFNLNLIDGKKASFSDLFSLFKHFRTGFIMNILIWLYKFLWGLLFIIPGIVKTYSYAMTPYILSEYPEMSVKEAIALSQHMMDGNKWDLFCLRFSFIGWYFIRVAVMFITIPIVLFNPKAIYVWFALTVVVSFAVSLILSPYKEAAQAAFYRDITYDDKEDCDSENQEREVCEEN